MRYLMAILIPPLAVLSCGRPFLAILNFLFTLCLWLPGAIHAMLVVHSFEAERRNRELIRAISSPPRGKRGSFHLA